MSKNKDGFEVDEGRIIVPELAYRPTRLEKTKVADRAEAIVLTLLKCGPTDLGLLDLTDELIAGLKSFAGLKRGSRKRQLKTLNRMVRDIGIDELEAALEGGTPTDQRSEMLEQWRARIVASGDEAIDAFAEAYPQADRQQIRQLTRQARKAEWVGKSFKQLFKALSAAVKA